MLNDRVQKLRTQRSASVSGKPMKTSLPYVAPLIAGAALPFFAKFLDPMMMNPALWETFIK